MKLNNMSIRNISLVSIRNPLALENSDIFVTLTYVAGELNTGEKTGP